MKTDPDLLEALRKDLKTIALAMTKQEVRFLVDSYYQMQENRKRGYNQERAASIAGEPNRILTYLATQAEDLENLAKRALDYWSAAHPMGIWVRKIPGIGPVTSAGLLAHTDMNECDTVGKLYGFSGQDPTETWEKGEERPWSAKFRTLVWKIGESFVKVSGLKDDIYGQYYIQRKQYEIGRNERGELADQAATMLKKAPKHKQRATYKTGKLPDGHIHSRAKRWAVKLFLAHWWEAYYAYEYNTPPPKPWSIAHGGHVKYLPPPFPPPKKDSYEGLPTCPNPQKRSKKKKAALTSEPNVDVQP